MKRILLGQLACFGDCLYATTVAKQIKTDYPDCHLTWAISPRYRSVIYLNPYVDEVWEITVQSDDYYNEVWLDFQKEAQRRKSIGVYDEIVLTQIPNSNWDNYDGTIRSSTFNGYNKAITVAVDPVIRLSKGEIEKVREFAIRHDLSKFKEVVLLECNAGSGQSFMNPDFGLAMAKAVVRELSDVCFLISSHKRIDIDDQERIFECSALSYRENAELTKYCSLLVGCSSGITWLSTSDWAKKLNMVQILNREYQLFAGVKYDFQMWKLDDSRVIEITKNDLQYVSHCLIMILTKSFLAAKEKFDEDYKPTYYNFACIIQTVINNRNYRGLPKVILAYNNRNPHLSIFKLIVIALKKIAKTPGYFILDKMKRAINSIKRVYVLIFQ